MIVLDSTVHIDVLRGHTEARRALAAISARQERMTCSVVWKIELLAGMRPNEESTVRAFFGTLEWIPVGNEIAELAGTLANQFLRAFPGVDTLDYVIAATAMHYNADVWTRNVKHFPMFTNLTRPY
jgi:predicted nucleic acid-binding protein